MAALKRKVVEVYYSEEQIDVDSFEIDVVKVVVDGEEVECHVGDLPYSSNKAWDVLVGGNETCWLEFARF